MFRWSREKNSFKGGNWLISYFEVITFAGVLLSSDEKRLNLLKKYDIFLGDFSARHE